MKYVSLDLETTSLIPNPENILQVSMVVEDTSKPEVPVEDLPHLTFFVKRDVIIGEAYALAMNSWILDILSGRTVPEKAPLIYKNNAWVSVARDFLDEHFGGKRATLAGKNVASFDLQFLPKEIKDKFKHKVLDPGTLYINWETDKESPNFETCKRRAGLDPKVAHDALEDARDVIRLFRAYIKST